MELKLAVSKQLNTIWEYFYSQPKIALTLLETKTDKPALNVPNS